MTYTLPLLLISLLSSNAATNLEAFQSLTTEAVFFSTIHRIYVEEPFETIFLLQTINNACISSKKLWKLLKVPLLIASGSAPADKLKERFNSKQLAITCLSAHPDRQLLNVLASNLQYSRQTRIILNIADAKPTPNLLVYLRKYLENKLMPNVIAIFSNFYTENIYYRYHPFPSGHWVREFLNKTERFFLCHLANMQGKTFKTSPGQTAPRTMIYEDEAGQQHLSGYLGYMMTTFAVKHNISWQYLKPVIPGSSTYSGVIINYTREGILDVAITLGLASPHPFTSYPVENIEWFIMLPCPQPIEYSEIYAMVVTAQVIGILVILDLLFSLLETFVKHKFYKRSAEFNLHNILLNENIFRGIFGLTFHIRRRPILCLKMLYIFLFLLGLFVNNMYSAYFQTLLTSPPLKRKILTFDDMRRANLKIMFDRYEFQATQNVLDSEFHNILEGISQLVDTETFQRHRAEYDTKYAYTMPESLWPIFELQQRTFERKIFCLAPTLKIFDRLLLSIPLAENSYLKEPLNMLILRTMETGLVDHWRTMTFIDMWAMGKLSLKDNSSSEQFHNIRVEDMKLPWYLLLCGLGISSLFNKTFVAGNNWNAKYFPEFWSVHDSMHQKQQPFPDSTTVAKGGIAG
ncbi:uncharacterized protein LOC118743773 [Rhagoletis pomonella]|uniref:uncharacterized protein LOC118743773 n=1 Tax=Rhagoletis pomonella TaxID=28610 RepID=UPI001783B640|nr:uncharacterized protein LOC118743773 [Rhagoletis pomonella]